MWRNEANILIKKQNPDDGHQGLLLTNYKPKL